MFIQILFPLVLIGAIIMLSKAMAEEIAKGRREMKKNLTQAQLIANNGHMRNYIVTERYMGEFRVHCGFGCVDHAAFIAQSAKNLFGSNAQVAAVRCATGAFNPGIGSK